MDNKKNKPGLRARRRFLTELMGIAGGVSLLGMGLGLYSRQVSSMAAQAIRPPGVAAEAEFLSACIRCGLCVRDCPYDTLRLAQAGDDVPLGTPYFIARDIPCEMCEHIPCVKACPTGALDPLLEDIDDSRMGLALISDQESCIAFQGLRCEVCFNVCPLQGKAITLDMQHNPRSGKHALFIPVVHSDACTGCGKCERACILEESAIRILPINLVKGAIGSHYRLGWKEKAAEGGSLVAPDKQHQYNLPEGMRYDYEGEGLIMNGGEQVPFADDPLETLNKGAQ